MLGSHELRQYRAARREGWGATDAVRFAKAEYALYLAEFDERIWFTREDDPEFRPADMSDIPEVIKFETEGLADGSLELFGIVAHTPADPDSAASLWGIVVSVNDRLYPRYIEISLAMEIGAIPDMPMPFVRTAEGR